MQEEQAQGQVDWFLELCKLVKPENAFASVGIAALLFVLIADIFNLRCC